MSPPLIAFGEEGKLNEFGDKVQCHLCGRWIRNLGLHISRGHKIMCDDYREMFGLARSFALCSNVFSQQQKKLHGDRIQKYGAAGQAKIKALTTEERRALCKIKRRISTQIKN